MQVKGEVSDPGFSHVYFTVPEIVNVLLIVGGLATV
jgi:hypothetical protein